MNSRPHPLERFNVEDYLTQEMQSETKHEYLAGLDTYAALPERLQDR